MRTTRHLIAAALAIALAGASAPAQSQAPGPVRLELGEEGQFIRFISWHQIWTRAMQLNPGSQVRGEPATPEDNDWTWDVGLRRSRFLLWAEYDLVQMIFHFGIDNQTFNDFKPALFIHDVWGQLELVEDAFKLGAGMHYVNGISRMTNHSTLTFLTVDAPILNWPTIERTDQFARWLGVFARGQIAETLDYRLAIDRPMNNIPAIADGATGTFFNPSTNMPALQGYFFVMLDDVESNALPFMNGTYLGSGSYFNIGAGFLWLAEGMVEVDATGGREETDILAVGADIFLDRPLGGGALTSYLAYYMYDMGEDFLRNVGIMNIGTGGTSFNGAGNAYPVIGTGNHVYGEFGYLLPTTAQIQPYLSIQASFMDALDDPMILPELGVNYYLVGQNAKLTLNYRNRPIFEVQDNGDVTGESRASDLILQLHLRI